MAMFISTRMPSCLGFYNVNRLIGMRVCNQASGKNRPILMSESCPENERMPTCLAQIDECVRVMRR